MSEYRLVMKGVVKTFPGVKALDHAQLELRPGKVMALMGENGAGKSTLMKCMFGIYKMDEGEIEYEGEKVTITTPLDALNRGIAMVHQELQPIPARTVAENIWLGRYPTKKYGPVTVVDHAKMYKDTEELLKKLKLEINPRAKLGSLSIAQMQMVEIAKAVSANCKVLILDEPTSSLTANEVESLFRIMRELKALGVALASMKPMARLHLYDVIMRYALYGEEPTDLNGEQMRTFILIRPQLDANERKRQKKYKEKAIKKNNDEELNEFFTKTEDEENDNLRILNDIQYK